MGGEALAEAEPPEFFCFEDQGFAFLGGSASFWDF